MSECHARDLLEMEEFERRVSRAHQAQSVQELAEEPEESPGVRLTGYAVMSEVKVRTR